VRIAHVDLGREMRGGQWQALLLMRGLRDRGHESLLLGRAGSPLMERAKAEGFGVKQAGLVAVRRCGADLVHAHDARAHTLAALAAAVPLVVSRRVAFPVSTGILSRWKYRQPRLYLAVSGFVKRGLVEAGVGETRIRAVYDGVAPLASRPADGRVIAPASDDPRKGAAIARATGLPVQFSTDLATDLPGASVFVYLSESDGLGSAILLAMSCGVPVVASRVGGIPELVEDGVTGLLTPNGPAEVERRVRMLLDDPGLGTRLAEAARRRYEERFTADAMVDATLEAYRECLD